VKKNPIKQRTIAASYRGRAAAAAWVLGAAGAWLAAWAPVQAQSVGSSISGYVTVTSDYRRRGLSQSRGDTSIQVGGDYQHRSGFFTGAWIATMEYVPGNGFQGSSRQKEIGYYAGYSRRAGRWSFAATAGRYAYPDAARDYDYDEASGTVAYRDKIFLTASYTDDLFSRGASALNQEIGVTLPLPGRLELGATLGVFDSADLDVRYTHWNLGLSKTFARRLGLDVRYYDNSGYFASPLGATSGDHWVVSASLGF